MTTSEKVRKVALGSGAHIVGNASVDRFEKAPQGYKPDDLLPGAKAVVVAGLPVPIGVLKSPNLRLYRNAATHLEHELNRIAYELALFLERDGYPSLPVNPDIPLDMHRSGGLMGDLSHKHAAAEAGLGIIGKSTLLVTPELGPRLRLISVVTQAPLESDPKLGRNLCRGCFRCVEACPAAAISEEGQIDKLKCLRQCLPYGVGGLIRFLEDFLDTKDKDAGRKMLREPRALELHQFVRVGNYSCAECVKACPVGKTNK